MAALLQRCALRANRSPLRLEPKTARVYEISNLGRNASSRLPSVDLRNLPSDRESPTDLAGLILPSEVLFNGTLARGGLQDVRGDRFQIANMRWAASKSPKPVVLRRRTNRGAARTRVRRRSHGGPAASTPRRR